MEYAQLLENSNDLIQVVSFAGQVIYVNRMWHETLGYSEKDLDSLNFFDLLHEDFHCDCQGRIERLLAGETVPRFEVEFKTRDGSRLIAEGSIALYFEADEPIGLHGFFRDITVRKATERKLIASEERFRTIFQSSVAGMAMVAPDGHFLQANPAFCRFLGYSEEALRRLTITDVTHPDDIEETLARRNITMASPSRAIVCEKRYLRKDGSVFWAQLSSTWFFDAEGKPLYTVPVIQDITSRKEAEVQIRNLAYYDSLTQLPNRSLLTDRLEQAVAQARRREGSFALLFLDLDRFKVVNDSLGHSIGDDMLCQAAVRLSECLRQNDTVARLGGDEFVIILSDYRDDTNLPRIAEKILQAVSQPFDLGVRSIVSTTSIGIALYPQDGDDPAELLRCADMAMYAAKDAGGNTFKFYLAQMNTKAVSRMDMEANLRRALVQEELFVEYQPQIDLVSNKVAGVEALVRWKHPQLGILAPCHFIPLAEESSLILLVGEWVMRKVFEQCVQWQQQGRLPYRVGINVSGRQFIQGDLVATVSRLLDETGADPHFIELEITESVLMGDLSRTVKILEQLRTMGIHLAVDDFGTGYSSLSCLKNFPVDRLKIDKSFIADLSSNANDRAIVDATIEMAKRLDLGVIAEGVETDDQYGFIHASNCDEVQGFYFSKPLSVADLQEKWLHKHD